MDGSGKKGGDAKREGRRRGDGVVWGEVNSAERIERQWAGLMSHEAGFTGAEAFPSRTLLNPPSQGSLTKRCLFFPFSFCLSLFCFLPTFQSREKHKVPVFFLKKTQKRL